MVAKLYVISQSGSGEWIHYDSFWISEYVTVIQHNGKLFNLRSDGCFYEGEPSYNWVNHVGR